MLGEAGFTVSVDLMAEPSLWRWTIRDPKTNEAIASSWADDWMAYATPDEARRAAGVRLRSGAPARHARAQAA
jgi:hypothetical protein